MKQGFSALLYLMLILIIPIAQAALPSPLKVAISNDTYPYMYVNQQGQPEGLVVDYWQEIAQQQQIDVQFIASNWPETLDMFEQRQVDIHGAIVATSQRKQQYQLGDIGVNIYSNIFIHRDMPDFKTVQQLKPLTIGVIERSSHVSSLQALIPEVKLIYFSNAEALYDAAIQGEILAFSGLDMLPANYANYKQLSMLFPLYKKMPIAQIDLNYAVYDNPLLYEQLQLATQQIQPNFIKQLEKQWLSIKAEKDTLLLGVPVHNPPYMHITNEGEAIGVIIELWQAWAKKTGYKIAFIPDTASNNIRSLEQGRIDAIVALPLSDYIPNSLREAYHLYGYNSYLYSPKAQGKLQLDKLTKGTIALAISSPYIADLIQKYPQLTFKTYTSFNDMLNAVQQQEAIGFIGLASIVAVRLEQLNLTNSYIKVDGFIVEGGLYPLVQASNTALANIIHQGFSELNLEELEQIEQRWLPEPERYFVKFRHKVPLTAAERHWLDQRQPIKLGIVKDWPPMEFVNEEGMAAGITVDIINIMAQRLSTNIEIQVFKNVTELKAEIAKHNIDIIGSVAAEVKDDSGLLFTDEYWSSQWAVISSVSSDKVTNIKQLVNKRVAIYKEYNLATDLKKYNQGGSITLTDDLKQAISLLQHGEVDVVVDSVEAAGQYLRAKGFVNLQIQVIDELSRYPTKFAVRDDYKLLVKILNKGLRSIGQDGQKQVYKKWFDFEINQGVDKKQYIRIILQLGGAVFLIIIFFLAWNFSLRKEVGLRRIAEQKMRFMATHDELTQLPNRSLLKERLQQALLQHARHNEMLALLFIDLDGFKDINDKYGHAVGDELLQNFVGILQAAVRKSDTVSRFGGDEFVLLLTGLMQPNDAAIVAEKILAELTSAIKLSVGPVFISASIGIAVYPDDGTDSEKLLKVSDNLMYRVKQQGKNHYCFSKPSFS